MHLTMGLVAFLVLGIAGALGFAELSGLGCNNEERTVFEDFPQYDGSQTEPDTSEGSCVARFSTSDSQEEVLAYYSERLRENGWEVELIPNSEEPLALDARRDGYQYRVDFHHRITTTPGGSTSEEIFTVVQVSEE